MNDGGHGALTLADWRAQHRVGSPLKILVDAELRAHVDELLQTETFGEIARRCRERFGRPRAPSKSAIGRYWRYLQARQTPAEGQSSATLDDPAVAPGGPVHGRRKCLWCHGALPRPATQQAQQRFCAARCRSAFHSAARRWATAAVADGRLSVAELRRHAPSPKES